MISEKIMLHEGHRGRMIEKLKKNESFPEHELLEILLFNAIPRKNTNEIAHRLLVKFRSIRNVFLASIEDIASVEGMGESSAAYLKVIGMFYEKYKPKKQAPEVFDRDGKFRDFLIERYRGANCEVIDIFFLDKRCGILDVKTFSSFSADHVEIDSKTFAKAVAESSAASVVIVHNHPGCSCMPSYEDELFTKKCMLLCSMTNVELIDHCIVGENGMYSYYNSGMLYQLKKRFSIGSILNDF